MKRKHGLDFREEIGKFQALGSSPQRILRDTVIK